MYIGQGRRDTARKLHQYLVVIVSLRACFHQCLTVCSDFVRHCTDLTTSIVVTLNHQAYIYAIGHSKLLFRQAI